MNKPKMVREGFVDDEPFDRPVEPPFEREERPAERRVKQVEEKREPPAPVAGDEWPMVIKLRKPIMIEKGEMITEVRLREPTTGDIMAAGGNPCRIDITAVNGKEVMFNPVIDDVKMLKLIANLADVMAPFMSRLDPRDYNTIAYQLRRFFLPEGKLW